jgi:hypothetical protein
MKFLYLYLLGVIVTFALLRNQWKRDFGTSFPLAGFATCTILAILSWFGFLVWLVLWGIPGFLRSLK